MICSRKTGMLLPFLAVLLACALFAPAAQASDHSLKRQALAGNANVKKTLRKILGATRQMVAGDDVGGAMKLQDAATVYIVDMQVARARIKAEAPSTKRGRVAKPLLLQAFSAYQASAKLYGREAAALLNGFPFTGLPYSLAQQAGSEMTRGSRLYDRAMTILGPA